VVHLSGAIILSLIVARGFKEEKSSWVMCLSSCFIIAIALPSLVKFNGHLHLYEKKKKRSHFVLSHCKLFGFCNQGDFLLIFTCSFISFVSPLF